MSKKYILAIASALMVFCGVNAQSLDGYYTVKNNGNGNNSYVNVAGRKSVTFVDEGTMETAPGTVIKIKTDANYKVLELRSQGCDLQGYANRAIRYVPELVRIVAKKLSAEGAGNILGENGLDAILNKFEQEFDHNLYLEPVGDGYRIYGKTPSMQPVVDFYNENKAQVDAKLPMLENFVNDVISKVLKKTNNSGASVLVEFKLYDVWENMDNKNLFVEPVDDATKLAFLQKVLSNKDYVWDFAYHAVKIYYDNFMNHPRLQEFLEEHDLGEYASYLDYIKRLKNVQPDFKYYIVADGNKIDFISEGNVDIIGNAGRTIWTVTPRADFTVNFDNKRVANVGSEHYISFYADFAYSLPTNIKAYKVTGVSEKGVAQKEELTGIIPAQTPVLLVLAIDPQNLTDEVLSQYLTLEPENTDAAPTDNLLVGYDALIDAFQIKTPIVESLFSFAKNILGDQGYDEYVKQYEHLMLRNAGTVNNKYFFALSDDEKGKCTDEEGSLPVRGLYMGESGLGFYEEGGWEVKANQAFIFTDEYETILLSMVPDVNRDGIVSITDVTCLVEIILGKDKTFPFAYDHDAADYEMDNSINVSDVTKLVNYILSSSN